jgi:hypothetical protein
MAQWVLLEMWVNIQRIIGAAHCANVVWLDLDDARQEAKTGVQQPIRVQVVETREQDATEQAQTL